MPGNEHRDIGLLKYEDIKGDVISYVRQKTKDTEIQETPIQIPLTDAIQQIIRAVGNSLDTRPSSYVFNIVNKSMDAMQQDAVIQAKN